MISKLWLFSVVYFTSEHGSLSNFWFFCTMLFDHISKIAVVYFLALAPLFFISQNPFDFISLSPPVVACFHHTRYESKFSYLQLCAGIYPEKHEQRAEVAYNPESKFLWLCSVLRIG